MKLLEFKSGYFTIVCHPDKVDYFVKGNEQTSGAVINTNFLRINPKELDIVIEEYNKLMSELEAL